MTPQEVLAQLDEIFRDVLDNPDIKLSEKTVANDIEEWDSLNNIHLVIAIEKHFKVKFTSAEIQNWENVGAMCVAISKKLG